MEGGAMEVGGGAGGSRGLGYASGGRAVIMEGWSCEFSASSFGTGIYQLSCDEPGGNSEEKLFVYTLTCSTVWRTVDSSLTTAAVRRASGDELNALDTCTNTSPIVAQSAECCSCLHKLADHVHVHPNSGCSAQTLERIFPRCFVSELLFCTGSTVPLIVVGSATQPMDTIPFAELGELPWISMVQSLVSAGQHALLAQRYRFPDRYLQL